MSNNPSSCMLKIIKDNPSSSGSIVVSRRMIATSLFLFFILAFVATPYWTLISSQSSVIVILSVIIVLGGVWSYLSAGDIQLNIGIKSLLLLGVFLVGMTTLNYGTLTSVIPWRGDESTFIERTRDLISRIPVKIAITAPLLFIVILIAVARKSRLLIAINVLLEGCIFIQFFQTRPFNGIGSDLLLRWPYVNYWFFVIAPYAAKYLWDPNHEFLYRIIPLLSAVGTVWIVSRKLTGSNFLINLLWGGSIATIPIVFYYSSILYIELLAVFLMVIVCFHANDLLSIDFNNIKRSPGWLALVLLGFIKETVIVFLLCFLVHRTMIVFQRQIKMSNNRIWVTLINYLKDEWPVFFCVSVPYILYIILRFNLTTVRGYSPDLSNLFKPTLYKITAQSFIEQFGIYLPFFFWGIYLLFRKKDCRVASFTLLLLLGVPVFYGLDSKSQVYLGYSRFNLFVLPAILVGSIAVLNQISKWGKIASALVACFTIVANLAISPIYRDGTKVPYWGNYVKDTSEHYYPYDQALLWLKNNHGSERILFSEMFYKYYLNFYFLKFGWHPKYDILLSSENTKETTSLSNALSEAEQEGFSQVLYQVKGNYLPQPNSNGDFCLAKVFKNQAHILLLFSKFPNCVEGSK